MSRAVQWPGAHDNSSFGSCSSSLAFDADEAMSVSSKMAKETDEAMSESSWTALAKEKERDWWSIDLEGYMGKLEVEGPWSGTEGGSVEPKGKMGYTGLLGQKSQEKKVKSRKKLGWKWMVMCLKKRLLKSKVGREK